LVDLNTGYWHFVLTATMTQLLKDFQSFRCALRILFETVAHLLLGLLNLIGRGRFADV
jgi:hypothetical protein